jgi:hypothetical protein
MKGNEDETFASLEFGIYHHGAAHSLTNARYEKLLIFRSPMRMARLKWRKPVRWASKRKTELGKSTGIVMKSCWKRIFPPSDSMKINSFFSIIAV